MYDPERDEIIYQRLIWIFKPIIKLVHKKQNKHAGHWVMITSDKHRDEIEKAALETLHCKWSDQSTYPDTGDTIFVTMMVKSEELLSIFAIASAIDPQSTWKDWYSSYDATPFPKNYSEIRQFNKSSKISL